MTRIDFDLFLFCLTCWFLVDFQRRLDEIDATYVREMRRINAQRDAGLRQ